MSFGATSKSLGYRWPTEDDPFLEYKFGSMWLELSQDLTTIERETYNALEWLGDVGGLFDMLQLIGSKLVSPFSALAL